MARANHSSGRLVRSPGPSVSTRSPARASRGTCASRSAAARQVHDVGVGVRVEHRVEHEPARHARARRFVLGVDVGEHDGVGADERVGEVLPEQRHAREAVRLEHHDDVVPLPLPCRADHAVHLAGQVRVVVDVGDAVALAAELEPTG